MPGFLSAFCADRSERTGAAVLCNTGTGAHPEALALESGTLARLNPELRRNATPKEPYQLKVPLGASATLLASLETLPKWDPPAAAATETEGGTHRVRSGDTLSGIASRLSIDLESKP